MRRICFDIESNYFAPKTVGINEPWEARAGFEGKTFRFDAATAFDSAVKKYCDFTSPRKLFELLLKADEIVTYNGRVCDLIVLEKTLGINDMARVWRKPHHDLIGLAFRLESHVGGCGEGTFAAEEGRFVGHDQN